MGMVLKHKCIFLDRDGILNKERGDYTWKVEDFFIEDHVSEALQLFKNSGYLLIVVTNQAGISKGLYTRAMMHDCHQKLQNDTGNLIDDFMYCPWHPTISKSLARKPNTIMFERAIALYNINTEISWMIGDRDTDMLAGKSMGLKTVLISGSIDVDASNADFVTNNLLNAAEYILNATLKI